MTPFYTGQQSTEDAAARAAGDAAQKRAAQSSWPPTESDFEAVGAAAGSAGGAAACVATGAGAGAAGLCAAVGGFLGGAIGGGVYQLGEAIAGGLVAGEDPEARAAYFRDSRLAFAKLQSANEQLSVAIMRFIAVANYGATPQQAEEQIPPNLYPETPVSSEWIEMVRRVQARGGAIEESKRIVSGARVTEAKNRAKYLVQTHTTRPDGGLRTVEPSVMIAQLDAAQRQTWPALAGVYAEIITARERPATLARNPAALQWAIEQQARLTGFPARMLSGIRKFFGRVLGI